MLEAKYLVQDLERTSEIKCVAVSFPCWATPTYSVYIAL